MGEITPTRTLATLLVTLASIQGAYAAHFSVIATVEGAAQIGAIKHNILYGTLPFNGSGVLFSLTESGNYSQLHAFNGGTDGLEPNAGLAIDAKGNVFGTTPAGGENNVGTLWEYSSAAVFSTPHVFGSNGDGASPYQGPTLDGRGTIVGTASQGAVNNDGSIFSLSEKKGIYDTLYEFLSGADGHCPFSGVAVTATGAIYGTTVGRGWGGNPNGGVWRFTQGGGLQSLYVFQNGSDGEWPDQAPVVDTVGNVFGTTHVRDGNNFAGAIWTINAAGSFSVLYDLNDTKDGYSPNSPLLFGIDGNLYGTTETGGADNYGTIFRVSPSGTFQVLHSFTGGVDGASPTGNLVQNPKGVIFGGTAYGTVFKIRP